MSFQALFHYNIEVQFGHLVAATAILVLQYGHSFSVGAAGSYFFSKRALAALIALMMEKTINAMIRKLITAVMKLP